MIHGKKKKVMYGYAPKNWKKGFKIIDTNPVMPDHIVGIPKIYDGYFPIYNPKKKYSSGYDKSSGALPPVKVRVIIEEVL